MATQTVLFHKTCQKGQLKQIEELLEKGVDIEALNEDKHTAL